MNTNKIPLVDLKAQYLSMKGELDLAIHRVIENNIFILGPEVESFEKAFAAFCGARHCIGTANGTDATALALQAVGVGPGDDVITVAHTFIATAEGISELGARPVFVDVLPDTLLMDPSLVEAAITPRTRAIVPVHLYGQMADMDAIMDIAHRYDLKVVEDACQAHGAEYKGRRAGSIGDAATFSFYPGKNLGAYGDAGAITTSNDDAAAWLRQKRNHGRASKYTHDFIGRNSRMDGIQGAILSEKLPRLNDWSARRREIAACYREHLAPIRELSFVETGPGALPVFHLFVVRVPRRDEVMAKISARNIEVGIHYPVPLHLQRAYAHLNLHEGAFPVTEAAAKDILSLPIFPEITEEQILIIVDALRQSLEIC